MKRLSKINYKQLNIKIMGTKVTVKNESEATELTLRQRINKAGLSLDNLVCRIEGKNKSVSVKGTWFIMSIAVLVNGIFENFICKLCAGGTDKPEYTKQVEDWFNENFKEGDWQLTNLALRIKGESWTSEDGKSSGIYEQTYINIPFTSDMIYLGKDAVMNQKKQEAEYHKLLLAELAQQPE
jgi:hypothetical protein